MSAILAAIASGIGKGIGAIVDVFTSRQKRCDEKDSQPIVPYDPTPPLRPKDWNPENRNVPESTEIGNQAGKTIK